MINFNGTITEDANFSLTKNSAFLYGDALIDTLVIKDNSIVFIEAHYFRLLAGMRQLRMEIPNYFTQNFWKDEILKITKSNNLENARVRTTIYRDTGGLLVPESNEICFLIQCSILNYQTKSSYTVGIYFDNYINNSSISSIKTTNRNTNTLASIYATENSFDNCLLINHKKQIVAATNANIFLVFGKELKTPALNEGAIDGIIRKKIIELVGNSKDYEVIECEIDAFELLKADEVFITNSVIGIQPVTEYKRKNYTTIVSNDLAIRLNVMAVNSN